MKISITVLFFGGLLTGFLFGILNFWIWPLYGISISDLPPHVIWLNVSALSWFSNAFVAVALWLYSRGQRNKGGR